MRRPRSPLASRRRARGLSQETLAERLGVDRSTVARWEGARTAPQPAFRPRLAAELGWSTEELHAALAEAPPARPVGEEAVLDLHDALYDLARRYDTVPSAHLLAPAVACHHAAVTLAGAPGDPALAPRLRTAAAEAAILHGRVLWDASLRTDNTGPPGLFAEAVASARAAGDRIAECHALLRTCYVALYGTHDPVAGAAHAQRAATVARHSPALRALALLHVAEAHAMLGEARDCDATLDTAHALLADPDTDDPGRFLLDPAPFRRLAGAAHLRLGRPATARALLDRAADDLPPTKTTTLLLGTLARAHAHEGHLDAAVATLHRAADQLAAHRGAAGLRAVGAAMDDLARWRAEPSVATLRDHLNTIGAWPR
ncbi:helix-turn-helix transcriptional regulator [Longispora sp. K20-0274]|uniref:helix-turn-helix domain-containing protein n=1 Tax=Longispora sp. K20-0274 TaxID=3088255 RepID=UPI00399C34A3